MASVPPGTDRQNGHRAALSPAEATHDLVGRLRTPGAAYWPAVLLLLVLAAVGIAAFIIKLGSGQEPLAKWGVPAAALAFLLSTAQGTPVFAFATRLAKGFWALPARRAAELGALSGLVTTPMFIALLWQLPDFHGRPSIWGSWPASPLLWDSIMMGLLTFTGLALLALSARPDRAVAKREPWRWPGAPRQWDVLTGGLVVLGAFYLMVLVFVHVFVVSDLAMSLTPGWKSAIFPPYHAVSGLQGAVATVILLAGAFRRFGGLSHYIGLDVFWGAAKIMLGLSLLFFYFTWSELLTYWYGRTPEERFLLDLFMFGPYLWLFIASFVLNFVAPFFLLIWNPIRVSIRGPIFVASLILLGNLIDRLRIYVASWSVAGPVGRHFEFAPARPPLDVLDPLILIGAASAFGAIYLLALRFVPPVSIWELKTGLLLRTERPYLKTEVAVVAKPR